MQGPYEGGEVSGVEHLGRLFPAFFGVAAFLAGNASSAHTVPADLNEPALEPIAKRWNKNVAVGLAEFCTMLDSSLPECIAALQMKDGTIPAASVCGRQHAAAINQKRALFWHTDWQSSPESGAHLHTLSNEQRELSAMDYATNMVVRWRRAQKNVLSKQEIDAKYAAFHAMAYAHPRLTGETFDITCYKGKERCEAVFATRVRNPDFVRSEREGKAAREAAKKCYDTEANICRADATVSPGIVPPRSCANALTGIRTADRAQAEGTITPASREEIFDFLDLCIAADAPEI